MTVAALLIIAGVSVSSASPVAAAPARQAARPAPAPQADDPLAEAYYLFLKGQALERRGDTSGAVTALSRAAELAPGAGEIRAELAALYARSGRALEAVREGEAALKVDPDNREAHRILGFVQAALADRMPQPGQMIAQAIGHFEKALTGDSRDPGMELTLGRLYLRTEQFLPAIRTLRRFLLIQPGHTEGMTLLAQAFSGNREPAEAIVVLEELAREMPDDTRPRIWLGEMYEEAGRWDKAAEVWAPLAVSHPTEGFGIRQATALVNAGDLDGARTTLSAMTGKQPTEAMAWYLLAQVERRSGRYAEAEAAARRILALDADDARGLLALAETQTARGDHAGVVKTLEARVASPRPDDEGSVHARLAIELAVAYQSLKQPERAVKVLEAARARVPDDDDLNFDLGAAYERAGLFAEAERAFRQVIAASPTHAPALNYLGYMLADRGEKLDEALTLVRRALDADPGNPSYLDSLAWAYFKLGRPADARDPIVKAAAARPRSSVIQEHAGEIHVALKDYKAAVEAFDRALAGDRDGIDVAALTRKRDRARALAGG